MYERHLGMFRSASCVHSCGIHAGAVVVGPGASIAPKKYANGRHRRSLLTSHGMSSKVYRDELLNSWGTPLWP